MPPTTRFLIEPGERRLQHLRLYQSGLGYSSFPRHSRRDNPSVWRTTGELITYLGTSLTLGLTPNLFQVRCQPQTIFNFSGSHIRTQTSLFPQLSIYVHETDRLIHLQDGQLL